MLAIFYCFALASLNSADVTIALRSAVFGLVAGLSWPTAFGYFGSQAWRIEPCCALLAVLDLPDSLCRDALQGEAVRWQVSLQ